MCDSQCHDRIHQKSISRLTILHNIASNDSSEYASQAIRQPGQCLQILGPMFRINPLLNAVDTINNSVHECTAQGAHKEHVNKCHLIIKHNQAAGDQDYHLDYRKHNDIAALRTIGEDRQLNCVAEDPVKDLDIPREKDVGISKCQGIWAHLVVRPQYFFKGYRIQLSEAFIDVHESQAKHK